MQQRHFIFDDFCWCFHYLIFLKYVKRAKNFVYIIYICKVYNSLIYIYEVASIILILKIYTFNLVCFYVDNNFMDGWQVTIPRVSRKLLEAASVCSSLCCPNLIHLSLLDEICHSKKHEFCESTLKFERTILYVRSLLF